MVERLLATLEGVLSADFSAARSGLMPVPDEATESLPVGSGFKPVGAPAATVLPRGADGSDMFRHRIAGTSR
jgi:hypothetical protein